MKQTNDRHSEYSATTSHHLGWDYAGTPHLENSAHNANTVMQFYTVGGGKPE